MRVVVDTNVLMSGLFFGGVPERILSACAEGKYTMVISAEVLTEYQRVAQRLSERFPTVEIAAVLTPLLALAERIAAAPLPRQICSDSDDDKFLACAVSGEAKALISGDYALQKVGEYAGVTVLAPREFWRRYGR